MAIMIPPASRWQNVATICVMVTKQVVFETAGLYQNMIFGYCAGCSGKAVVVIF
jgi:tetrahydromethanopterin S-methyltransferase subunit B